MLRGPTRSSSHLSIRQLEHNSPAPKRNRFGRFSLSGPSRCDSLLSREKLGLLLHLLRAQKRLDLLWREHTGLRHSGLSECLHDVLLLGRQPLRLVLLLLLASCSLRGI